jgi:hypothetical protein
MAAAIAMSSSVVAHAAVQPLHTPCDKAVVQAEADAALSVVKGRLASTQFAGAEPGPAGTCLIKLHLVNGNVAFTDLAGHYFFYGVIFDLVSNKQLDNGGAVPNVKGDSN